MLETDNHRSFKYIPFIFTLSSQEHGMEVLGEGRCHTPWAQLEFHPRHFDQVPSPKKRGLSLQSLHTFQLQEK
jgi:hypothetical protein